MSRFTAADEPGAVFGSVLMALANVNAFCNVDEPAAVVTTSAAPLATLWLGVIAVNAVELIGVMPDSAAPPSVAEIEPAVVGKFEPVTVIEVPPNAGPAVGVIAVGVGT